MSASSTSSNERRRIGAAPTMSQAVVAGSCVFTSGQVAIDADGELVGAGDPRAQAEQCFRNIEVLLAEAGGTMADITKITGFLVDADAAGDYLAVREAVFGAIGAPASSTVVVAALLDPRFLVEVEAVAVIDPARATAVSS